MKICAACGEKFSPQAKEGTKRFAVRKYCSNRCVGTANADRRKQPVNMVSRYRRVKIDGKSVLEHRYVMEQVLGRKLQPHEQVHHKDHDRFNNDPSNLEVVSSAEHGMRHTVKSIVSQCVICGEEFTPHKTKRGRNQTCGPDCKRALISLRARQRHQKPAGTPPAAEWLVRAAVESLEGRAAA